MPRQTLIKNFSSIHIFLKYLVFNIFLFVGCENEQNVGFLRIESNTSNQAFEIYRIARENPFQLVSEQVGYSNSDIQLTPGIYLVMADCSHKMIIIHPGITRTIVANELEFIVPESADSEGLFSVQCDRFERTRSRQNHLNNFKLSVLSGKWKILVGMVPMTLDFEDSLGEKPKKLVHRLGGVRVAEAQDNPGGGHRYFISPQDELLSISQPQFFGKWQFLLPGKYIVEVSGTKNQVELNPGELRTIKPAYLRLITPKKTDLQSSKKVRGQANVAMLNKVTRLSFNETYPLLPGINFLTLDDSQKEHAIELKEGSELKLKIRSVKVTRGCSPWEWKCLGGRKIKLYWEDSHYPFLVTLTDISALFFESQVSVGIEGGENLRYQLSDSSEHTELKMGLLKLIPRLRHSNSIVTDLVRLETQGNRLKGVSLDIPIDRETKIPLIAGYYHLATYQGSFGSEDDRTRRARGVKVPAGKVIERFFDVYLPEKKFKKTDLDLKKSLSRERQSGDKRLELESF